MPKKITMTMTLDDVDGEIVFTQAALEADPDAREVASLAEGWPDMLDDSRKKDRASRIAAAKSDARRAVANGRLDSVCDSFARDLKFALKDDLKHPRWTQFFKLPVSVFVRQALVTQLGLVKGWLEGTDPVLEQHRPDLMRWTAASDEALGLTSAVSMARGAAWQAREDLANNLTRERDSLHAVLGEIARQRGLPRDWADQFFRVEAASRTESGFLPPPAQG